MDKNNLVADSSMDSANSNPGYLFGINTITTSLGQRYKNFDISSIPTPKIHVSPWLQNKIDPDSNYNTNLR